jgi:hypothetical protein
MAIPSRDLPIHISHTLQVFLERAFPESCTRTTQRELSHADLLRKGRSFREYHTLTSKLSYHTPTGKPIIRCEQQLEVPKQTDLKEGPLRKISSPSRITGTNRSLATQHHREGARSGMRKPYRLALVELEALQAGRLRLVRLRLRRRRRRRHGTPGGSTAWAAWGPAAAVRNGITAPRRPLGTPNPPPAA